jgi:hypothetical protein
MTTYYGLFGQKVQYLASDPSDVQVGQVWYNYTSATLKVRAVSTAGTFASGGNLNNGRGGIGTSKNGTQTATIGAGGSSPVIYYGTNSESYNGSSWTTTSGLNTGRDTLGGAGTQTSALVFGGNLNPVTTATESWNGSSWTSVNSMNGPARLGVCGTGTQTAALGAGGYASGVSNQLQLWNGSSWTTSTSMGTSRYNAGTFGIQTAAITAGGGINPSGGTTATTESWNGSSWTAIASINTSRSSNGGAGTQTAGIIMGGYIGGSPSVTSATELYNGTSWTNNPTGLGTPRATTQQASGSQTSALTFGGGSPGNATEEWTGPGVAETKTVTVT